MAGLFGLFGGNKNKAPQSKEAFFLSEDDAKSFGNIDFMRKEVVVRRTFAKKKGQAEELESVKSISSSTSKEVGEGNKPATSSFGSFGSYNTPSFKPSTPAATSAPAAKAESTSESEPATPAAPKAPEMKRTPDSGMDMFRNMAKNMRR